MTAPRPLTVEITGLAAWRVAADQTATLVDSADPPPVLGHGWRLLYDDGENSPWRIAPSLAEAFAAADKIFYDRVTRNRP